MSKADIRKCRYANCKHDSRDIDTTKEEYKMVGTMYFHSDCFANKEQDEQAAKKRKAAAKASQEKTAKERADIQLIRTLWENNISHTVVYGQLYSVLNDLLARGIDSDYLVFVMNYVVNHKMPLRYPPGFRYFVDRTEIKNAYAKKQQENIKPETFVVKENDKPDTTPKFAVKHKPTGFGSILNGGK